jgi:hypothetical protein
MPAQKKKVDLKKEFKEFYLPSKEIHIIDIPKMNFFMVDGSGNPNNNPIFQDAVGTLYACAYSLKMDYKKKPKGKDYVVPPLEGLWFADDMSVFSGGEKDQWKWTLMIRIPDFVPDSEIKKAIERVKEKKREKAPMIDELRVEEYSEGTTVQVLYIGPYADEHDTIMAMHEFGKKAGYKLEGMHHEIYLSDLRRTAPEKLKTIIRQPIIKK